MSNYIKSEDTFKELIASETPVIIKFEADWCPDCKRMDYFMPDVEAQFKELPIYTIDKDEFPEIASDNVVMGIPSLLVFQNNEKLGHLHSANAKTPGEVTDFLKKNFN
ncbi:thioredoxin family protein [Exiguobacterium sp. s193]|uniref:thioredoxin family protein n=1 Tax=Exiguobacterium sp. s193 TaxID=2751207 RepID=UPI001BE6CAE6|nr:thioredoxin family protein [Exiguobacterium sp. s193]